jgi:hypothetical protein
MLSDMLCESLVEVAVVQAQEAAWHAERCRRPDAPPNRPPGGQLELGYGRVCWVISSLRGPCAWLCPYAGTVLLKAARMCARARARTASGVLPTAYHAPGR